MAIGVALLTMGPNRLLVVFLILLGCLVGWFPARRKIFDESWSLLGFLGHTTRFWLAHLGGLWLIGVLPWAVQWSPRHAVVFGSFIGVVAFVWNAFNARAVPWILRARLLDRPDLETAFEAVVSKSKCGPPRLYRVDARGGRFVNAMAVPSLGQSAVLFSDGLLDAMTTEEISAVFAHEIAHLEARTRAALLTGFGVFALFASVPLFVWLGPLAEQAAGWQWLWPLFLIFFVLHAGRQHRSHETESDIRAVELSGNPEALVSALTKIHALSHLPRRWSDDFEQASTHPSLARRIQAIRRAAGHEPDPSPTEVMLVVSPSVPRKAVVLDSAQLHWLFGFSDEAHGNADADELLATAEERRSIPYGELRELRLESQGNTRRLSFRDQTGQVTKMPVAPEDVARLETALDRLDTRLGYAAEAFPSSGRFWSLVVAIFGLTTSLSLLFLGVLALAVPSQASLAAAGVVAVAAAALALVRPFGWEGFLNNVDSGIFPYVCLGYAGLSCLFLAWRRHRLGVKQSPWAIALASAIPLVFVLGSLFGSTLASGLHDIAMGLHEWARHQPHVTMHALAIGAALLTLRNRLGRTVAGASVVAAVVFLFAGTRGFRSSFTSGPFAGDIAGLSIREAALTRIREVTLDLGSDDLLGVYLSPAGSRLAYELMPEANLDETDGLSAFSIEGMAGDFVTAEGLAFAFLDETRWALVRVDSDGILVEELALDGSRRTLASGLPWLLGIRFMVDGVRGLWRLEGYKGESWDRIVIQGSAGASETEVLRFTYDEESPMLGGVVTVDGRVLESTYDASALQRRADVLEILPWLPYSQEWALSVPTILGIRTPEGAFERLTTTAKLVSCLDRPPGETAIYCIGSDIENTELWSFASDVDHFKAVGWLPAGSYQGGVISNNEIVLRFGRQFVVVRGDSKTAVRLLAPGVDEGTDWYASFRAGKLAVSGTDDESGKAKITVYELVRNAR